MILTVQGLSTIDRAMTACVEGERELLAGVDPTTSKRPCEHAPAAGRIRGVPHPATQRGDRLAAGDELRVAPERSVRPRAEPVLRAAHAEQRHVADRRIAISNDCNASSPHGSTNANPGSGSATGEPSIAGRLRVAADEPARGAMPRDIAWAAAVVMQGHNVVATATATRKLVSPYQAGYLSLTIGPILEDVVAALSVRPDIVARERGRTRPHARRGPRDPARGSDRRADGRRHRAPRCGRGAGARTRIEATGPPCAIDNRLVGFRVRTISKANPVMAHAAWLTTPETARDTVLAHTGRQRMPEPLQRARELSRRLRSEYERTAGGGMQDGIHG